MPEDVRPYSGRYDWIMPNTKSIARKSQVSEQALVIAVTGDRRETYTEGISLKVTKSQKDAWLAYLQRARIGQNEALRALMEAAVTGAVSLRKEN